MLERLTEKHKSPIILYYMEDMTYQEIADFLEIPIGTVMSRLARAKKQMKKELLKKFAAKQKKSKIVLISTLLWQGVLR